MSSPELRPSRISRPVNGHSFIEAYPDGRARVVLVYVHGLFGDHKTTWEHLPTQLRTYPALGEPDYASFGFDSPRIQTRVIDETTDALVFWMKTHLRQYDHIFIIAHSMGGLIARDACRLMATRGVREEQELYSRIGHRFLTAVPISGSWAARAIRYVPFVSRPDKRIAYLANPLDGKSVQYSTVISAAKTAKSPASKIHVSRWLARQLGSVLQHPCLPRMMKSTDSWWVPIPR